MPAFRPANRKYDLVVEDRLWQVVEQGIFVAHVVDTSRRWPTPTDLGTNIGGNGVLDLPTPLVNGSDSV